MFRNLGPTEIILILLVVVLLFGAKKLPDLARGSGRALRIFKSETKGLMDDDADVDVKKTSTAELPEQTGARPADLTEPVVGDPVVADEPVRRDQAS